jgi:hypothetical protein
VEFAADGEERGVVVGLDGLGAALAPGLEPGEGVGAVELQAVGRVAQVAVEMGGGGLDDGVHGCRVRDGGRALKWLCAGWGPARGQ